MSKNTGTAGPHVDLSTCAQEPIQSPGSVQPHGFLLVMQEPALQILHVSENCQDLFRQDPRELIGRSLNQLLPTDAAELLSRKLQAERLQDINPIELQVSLGGGRTQLEAIAHRSQGLLFLELEPVATEQGLSFSAVYRQIKAAVEEIGSASELDQMYRIVTHHVKVISGYQRIMIYQFDADWNGEVVAEACEPHQQPFLGLHYPASDIPAQARALYLHNWLRSIPKVDYSAAALYPAVRNGEPLDLSGCSLRSVSPLHIQYLKNMGVGASTSVSVIVDGQLWGLIALHHEAPAYLRYEVRQGLEFIGRLFSIQLAAWLNRENRAYKNALKSLQPKLLQAMREEPDFMDGLHRQQPNFLALAACGGGAIVFRGKVTLLGASPTEQQVRQLVDWLRGAIGTQSVFHTASLVEHYPAANAFKDTASGLAAISIPEAEPDYVLWFKPEVVQTVNWGGNPLKALEADTEGGQLGPRRSFSLWQETVSLRSLPWAGEELEAIEDLRRSIIEVDLERQVRAAMASNDELDQFASVISHDLKEPLRGIGFFAEFLQEDLAGKLDDESQNYLAEIKQLSDKAKILVSELYEYSKVGRVEMSFAEVDLNQVVDQVAARLRALFTENRIQLKVSRPLPTVFCDRIRVAEVFANLLSNAAKYTSETERWVEVGADTSAEAPALYVRDNGIGIAQADHERVFKMFQRLHEPSEYGGGTGVGLAIVKRIVDRHGGRIWIESAPGQGATFNFTLRPATLS